MKSSRYCLLIFRPDIERIDVLCVGVVVLDGDGAWHISAPETNEKLQTFCAAPQHLTRMCVGLVEVLRNCVTLEQARARLVSLRSALALHEFEGMFSYITESDFNRQIQAILNESVLPATFPANDDPVCRGQIRFA